MIVFRVDGNEQIGLGHMMRCLSIADALTDIREDVLFVTADKKCERLLDQRGYRNFVLHTDFTDMNSELEQLLSLIDQYKPAAVFVDSYYVSDSYLRQLKDKAELFYLDDQLSFPYPADVVINYNIFGKAEDYKRLYRDADIVPRFVLGTEYTPLRSEFSHVVPQDQPEQAKKVLISTGGADPQHIALRMIRSIIDNRQAFSRFDFTFIIGGANADFDLIRALAQDIEQVNIAYNVQNMSQLMLGHDIAVSAAGSTLYELCACGLPTITYVCADNQIPAAKVFGEKGIMIDAGDYRLDDDFIRHIFDAVAALADDKALRNRMASAAVKVVDGCGANRLAKLISKQQEEYYV